MVYIVKSGENVYQLIPRWNGDATQRRFFDARLLIKKSTLNNQRRDPSKVPSCVKHFFVKVRNRESEYSVGGAE